MTLSSWSTDIVMHVFSAPGPQHSKSSTRLYDVVVYTTLPVSIGHSGDRTRAEKYNDLPLKGVGRLEIPWRRYQDYLTAFQEGEKGVEKMRIWMQGTLDKGLQDFVHELHNLSHPCRIWWTNEAPELNDMPWELVFENGNVFYPSRSNMLFVRGRPPRIPLPVLPLSGPLRLLYCTSTHTPNWLNNFFNLEISGVPGIVPIRHDGSLHEAIGRAVNEGIELLHICTDGRVSSAYEGILYCNDNDQSEMTAHELSSLLRGSRLSVIALTEQGNSLPNAVRAYEHDVVSVYRAFACFSNSRFNLPSIIAPIGPSEEITAKQFWFKFYSLLAERLHLDEAMRQARHMIPPSSYALFLRHGLGKLFRIANSQGEPMPAPEKMAVNLVSSIAAVHKVHSLNQLYGGLPEYLTDFMHEENTRQQKIREELDPWTQSDGENNEP